MGTSSLLTVKEGIITPTATTAKGIRRLFTLTETVRGFISLLGEQCYRILNLYTTEQKHVLCVISAV
jgi:hypothetical protein